MDIQTVEQTRTSGPEVGDILVSSWVQEGSKPLFDRYNVDFWRVVELLPQRRRFDEAVKSVRIMPVIQRVVERFTTTELPEDGLVAGVPGERVEPAVFEHLRGDEEPTTSLIRWYDDSGERQWCVGVPVPSVPDVVVDTVLAHPWDGRPVFQTAFGWGH